ncbi:hypothetical protein [Prescottella subtropica]|uniref:hypothetical protein n=1 Tax=Prescottella subtropica TaxID=2545757 RepID=UPI0010F5C695|nr:hypothetical protein [Prescottella subtropica]
MVGTCELLHRVGSDVGGAARQAASDLAAPIRIQVAGRAGVGRSSVVRLLEQAGWDAVDMSLVETSPVDAPGSDDPTLDGDVIVYVLSGAPRTPDVAALRAAPAGVTVAVVGKADLQRSWAEATRIAVETESGTGVPTLPLVAHDAAASGGEDGRARALDAVATAVRTAGAYRARSALTALAEAAARGPDRDVLENYLRSAEAARLRAASATVAGDGAAGRRRRELAARVRP